MPQNSKKKRPVIGDDGEFLDPIPVKKKRKHTPTRPFPIFGLVVIGLLSTFAIGIAILIIMVTSNVEPAPLPTVIPTIEPVVAVQVTSDIDPCDRVYALDDDIMSFITSESGRHDLHIYALNHNVWCTLEVPILQHMAWNVDGSMLAFTGVASTGLELFVINADGSNLTQLTEADGFNIDFPISWSTHDDSIAYTQSKSGYMAVYIINSDGTGQKLIYETSRPITTLLPKWGGGQNLVFSHGNDDLPSDQPQKPDVYIHDTVNNTTTQITKNPASDNGGVWLDYENDSPMLFRSDRDGKHAIYRMQIIGGDSQATLLTPDDSYADAPIVSPDQREFLYLANRFDQLIVMSADGSNRRIIVEAPSRIGDPQWSPDGQYVAYFLPIPSGGKQLNIVHVETGQNREITLLGDFGNLAEFAWRPRAELLAIPPR